MDETKRKLTLAEEQGQELTSKLHASEGRAQQLGNELKAEQQRSGESARLVARLRDDMEQLQKVGHGLTNTLGRPTVPRWP